MGSIARLFVIIIYKLIYKFLLSKWGVVSIRKKFRDVRIAKGLTGESSRNSGSRRVRAFDSTRKRAQERAGTTSKRDVGVSFYAGILDGNQCEEDKKK